jgi:hypothetical protein
VLLLSESTTKDNGFRNRADQEVVEEQKQDIEKVCGRDTTRIEVTVTQRDCDEPTGGHRERIDGVFAHGEADVAVGQNEGV